MARSQADALNTFDQLLHPFDGWTFGAYAHEAGQFGIGEAKGAVNMVAGSIVGVSPALTLADDMTGSRLSHPLASVGESQHDGEATFPWVVAAASGVEFLAAAPEAAEALAGVTRGPHCFVPGTPVQMADGSTTKPIEQVRVGDLVKCRNPKTGQVEAKRVDRVYVRLAPQVLTLTFTDAATHQAEAFTCTPEHPFYVNGRGFVKAEDLGIGTSLVTRAGPALTLSAVSRGAAPALGGQTHPAGIRVYNLRVEDDHSYFVGTLHGGTCVHNADYPVTTPFEVGTYKDLFTRAKDQRLEIHHLPQQKPAGDFIPGYDPDQGVAIALPRMMHRQLPGATSRLRGSYAGISTHGQRLIISRQLRDLKNANVPKDALRQLGSKIRSTYPSIYYR